MNDLKMLPMTFNALLLEMFDRFNTLLMYKNILIYNLIVLIVYMRTTGGTCLWPVPQVG